MKKISLSVMAIFMTVALATGAALALFSSTATVSGVTFSTGNSKLTVWNGGAYATDWSTMLDFTNMYPSDSVFQTRDMYLKNESTSDIALNVTMKLTGYDAWTQPAVDAIEFAVVDSTYGTNTGWHTLKDWRDIGYALTTNPLTKSEANRLFTVYSRVPARYNAGVVAYWLGTKLVAPTELVENEASGLSFNNAVFTLTGTQN